MGNAEFPSTSSMPIGKLSKIELYLYGAPGDQCFFDDIKFIQDFYKQNISTETYSVSPDFSEVGSVTGWNTNCLGKVDKNTIISYGSSTHISVQELYNTDPDPTANAKIQNLLEIEKVVNISGPDFPKAYLYWKEKGASIGYIDLTVGCSDGKSYPLVFSPTGYSLNNIRGVFNCKLQSDMSETKHSYNIESIFGEIYPELVNANTPITPTNINGMKIHYKLNVSSDWYSTFEDPLIEFKLKDDAPLTVTVNTPVNNTSCGKSLPISLVANKEIAIVDVAIVVDGNIIKNWKTPINNSGQTTFAESFNLQQLEMLRFSLNSSIMVKIEVTDIFGNKITIDRSVILDWGIPNVSLDKPNEGEAYNLLIPLRGSSNLLLKEITYQITDENGNIIKDGVFNYSTTSTVFSENIAITNAERSKKLILSMYGMSENDMNSDLVKRTIFINPSADEIQIGTVTNPTVTWDTSQTEPTLCNAPAPELAVHWIIFSFTRRKFLEISKLPWALKQLLHLSVAPKLA